MKVTCCILRLSLPLLAAAGKLSNPMMDVDSAGADATDAPPRSLQATPLYQVDQTITRVQLVGAHMKWLFCSDAFWVLTNGRCETQQKFVPDGYWFETGRPGPKGKKCSAKMPSKDLPIARCRVKKGLTMVLPIIQQGYIHCLNCNGDGSIEDPRVGAEYLQRVVRDFSIVKATLNGKSVSALDSINIVLQDGDADYTYPTVNDTGCLDAFKDYALGGGAPMSAAGPYVFIDTNNLATGVAHTLILIGKAKNGFCSAVKHIFTLY